MSFLFQALSIAGDNFLSLVMYDNPVLRSWSNSLNGIFIIIIIIITLFSCQRDLAFLLIVDT